MFRRSRVLAATGVAALTLAGGLAFAGSASASINNGEVISSNGEAGWFTNSGNRFDEVHADVITHSSAEQNSTMGAPTLGNGVGLCATTSTSMTGDAAAQIGEVWNAGEKAFDVVWAEGTLTSAVAPNTNGIPCTTGGALPVTLADSGGVVTPTCGTNVTHCGLLSVQTNDIPLGDRVYVQIRQWNTHFQFLAEDLNTGLGLSADNVSGFGSGIYAHYAQAGTIFDTTSRSAPANTDEADFSWVRASTTQSGEGETQGQYFDTWSGETVVSTPSGTSADAALVAPTGMNPKVAGGLGCFTMYVGSPTGA